MSEPNNPDLADSTPEQEESSVYAALERQLAEPVLRGQAGLDKAQVYMAAFLITMTGMLAYQGILQVHFISPDRIFFFHKEGLSSLSTFTSAVSSRGPGPLALLTIAATWWVKPSASAPHHAVSLVLHLANSVMVYLLARRLRTSEQSQSEAVPMTAGMLFALAPWNVEAVAMVTARSYLLAGFGCLLALILFLRATDARRTAIGALSLTGALAAFVIACLSHPLALLFPAVLTAVYWLYGRRRDGRRYWLAVALFWLVGMGGAGILELVGDHALMHTPTGGIPLAVASAMVAVGALVLPAALGGPLVWATLLYLGASLTETSPAAGLLTDRLLYVAGAGACMCAPWLIDQLRSASLRTLGGLIVTAVIMVAGISTFSRVLLWQDEIALWDTVAQRAPDSIPVHVGLGEAYLIRGHELQDKDLLENAKAHFGHALTLGERRPEVVLNYCNVLAALDEYPKALEVLTGLGGAEESSPYHELYLHVRSRATH